MYAVAAAGILVAGALGLAAEATPAGQDESPPGAVAISSSSTLRGVAITIDRVAFESGTWIHVIVTNSRSDEVEWNPAAVVSGVAADYARSTHLPGDIDPGQTVSGWIYAPVDARTSQLLEVRFRDVAVDDYASVGDLVLQLNV